MQRSYLEAVGGRPLSSNGRRVVRDETGTFLQRKEVRHRNWAAPEASLKRELGLPTATALVVGNMIGSGIFLLPPRSRRSRWRPDLDRCWRGR